MNDEYYMRIAINLALKAKGQTSPNPLVGALIVKNSRIISSGYHHKAGLPHAEIIVLNKAGKKAKGAKLYINLEPCCHFGRTAPCVYAILESGIKKVIIGTIDPNPMMNGKSIKLLQAHGVEVKAGILEKECLDINQPFIKYITKRIPYVTVKTAQSLDGRIATKTGQSKWITTEYARKYSHNLRKLYDAIVVGVNTVIKDNPLLNSTTNKRFFKVVIDRELKISTKARIFSKESKAEIIIASGNRALESKKNILEKMGAKVLTFAPQKGQIPLKKLLSSLAELEISNILVEGGGETIGRFFDANLVDKVLFFIAAKIIGGKEAISSVMGEGIRKISQATQIKDWEFKKIGQDLLIEGNVYRYN
ncbi:MAG: bifunctional diaminohydroxyphosphoribosylaminopyrimidine deaminase/5-amino-6-(5-phosphoribosylamino)uracil reductase RibD [Candidatus Omnitrophota bacterium]|nr:bifunctional diaminohydroxyphosphoribosylaminopyrimidine deaminase/5-amino-6-(5-phosphoribosylamino)uracil reductase RibD [Candidatus Omnitrophota bacterium]